MNQTQKLSRGLSRNPILTQAVILAGGKGTRLASVLNGKPKPLIPILGTPLLKIQIEKLKNYGINQILILVNYKAEHIRAFIEKEFPLFDIKILEDGEIPLGSGGSLIKHREILAERFLLIYGDTYFDIDFLKLKDYHFSKKADVTVFSHPNNHPFDSDIISVNSNWEILKLYGYPHPNEFYSKNLVTAASYIIEKKVLYSISNLKGEIDFAKKIIPELLTRNYKLIAYNSKEYIKDCGTPDRLKKIEVDINKGLPELLKNTNNLPVVLLDRDGTIIEHIPFLNKVEDLKLIDGAAKAIKILNDNAFFTGIVTNQPVIARGDLSHNELERIHNKLEWELGKNGSYVDSIKFCPHHPHKGYIGEIAELKISCECRKPNTGMLNEIFSEHNFKKINGWMVGDSSMDIKCAQNFGISSILVRTGLAGMDGKHICIPDYSFENILEAVQYITEGEKFLFLWLNTFRQSLTKSKNISISGISKSGKTNFASGLKKYLTLNGVKSQIVHLDNFLTPRSTRKKFPDVYNIDQLTELIETRNQGRSIILNNEVYDRNLGQTIESTGSMRIDPDDILILEGLNAYNFIGKLGSSLNIYLDVDNMANFERFENEYASRGKTKEEIKELYLEREVERQIIKDIRSKCNFIYDHFKNPISN